ncbi:MAG: peroxiredoxin-like family protein [Pirellulaceae bacterium]
MNTIDVVEVKLDENLWKRMSKCTPSWMSTTLYMAAMYNLLWGAWVVFMPNLSWTWSGAEPLNYPPVWQGIGMIVGVYGIGYAIAASAPMRHWPIVLVGLIGKVLGPIGFAWSWYQDLLPGSMLLQLVFNDLIWWIPFSLILYRVWDWNSDPAHSPSFRCTNELATNSVKCQRGDSLDKLSFRKPTVVVFLRHAGCTFCRQTLTDLAKLRSLLAESNVAVAIVHMGTPLEGTIMLSRYDLDYFHHFSDPECELYRAFGLERGNWKQLFSFRVFLRGIKAALQGHGIGKIRGDGFQLPGVFVMVDGRVVHSHRAVDASERFDFESFVRIANTSRQQSTGKLEPAVAD